MDETSPADETPSPASRRIAGSGTPESTWTAWDGFGQLTELSLDNWLPATGRLVVLAPHPDDEILACGGLLAMHAERGGSSLLVAASDGEASHDGVAGWTAPLLAAVRRTESAHGLAALELARYAVLRLGLRDGRIGAHAAELESRLKPLLRPGDLLVTTWRLDGHPDHEACGLAAAEASRKVGCRLAEAPVWMWHWASPGLAGIPWHRLHRLTLPAGMLARKRRALAAHASQLAPRPRAGDLEPTPAPSHGPASPHAHAPSQPASPPPSDAQRYATEDLGPVLGDGIVARSRRPAEYFFI